MFQCKNCGNMINNDVKFCPNCGAQNEEYVETGKNTNGQNILKNKKIIIIAIAIIVVIAIIVGIIVANQDNPQMVVSKEKGVNFKKVYNEIGGDGYYITLASDNSCIEADTNPLNLDDFSSTEAWELIKKLNDALDLPEAVETKMETTRAMDGRITQTYGKITVSWTYHPDKGLQVLYEKSN